MLHTDANWENCNWKKEELRVLKFAAWVHVYVHYCILWTDYEVTGLCQSLQLVTFDRWMVCVSLGGFWPR